MSKSRTDLLNKATEILKILDEAKIISSSQAFEKLNKVRILTREIANTPGTIAPGLTTCIATTLLNVGLCQELSQRFLLEYCIKYQAKDISLVFLSNPAEGYKKQDHVFVLIGSLVVPDELIIGREASACKLDSKKANQNFMQFLTNNHQSIFADPLLHCVGNLDDGLNPLLAYCKLYNLTHVVGVRCFSDTPGLVENAPVIKANAHKIAEMVKRKMDITNNQTTSVKKVNTNNPSTTTLFDDPIVRALVKKYDLLDHSQASFEKGLRKAATNDKIDDLKVFINLVKNINAQDANPKVQRTALHWAAIKGHKECCLLLLDAGANPSIADANAETAFTHLTSLLTVNSANLK